MAIDIFSMGLPSTVVLNNTLQSLALSMSMILLSSAIGVLIGVGSPSVLVGVILVIYGGNQLSVIPLLPSMLTIPYPELITILIGVVISCVLLGIAIFLFNKKQF
jgi:ABC-2 type transport system permease protein